MPQRAMPVDEASPSPVLAPDPLPAPRSSRRLFLTFGLGVLLLASSFGGAGLLLHAPAGAASGPAGSDNPPPMRRAVAIAYVDVKGGVTPMQPLKSGRVVAVPVTEGQSVDENTVLVQMEDIQEQQQLAEARQDLAGAKEKMAHAQNLVVQHQERLEAARASIEVLKKDVDLARLTHKRAQRLYNTDVGGSQEEVAMAAKNIEKAQAAVAAKEKEVAVLEATDAQIGVRAAEADIKAKEAQVKRAEYGLEVTRLKPQTKGQVLRCQVTVGETLGPNPRHPAILFASAQPMIIRAEVEQDYAHLVQVGQEAFIQDDVTGSGSWKGKVASISPWIAQRRSVLLEPLQFNDVRTLECIIEVEQSSAAPLRIGQRMRVTIAGVE